MIAWFVFLTLIAALPWLLQLVAPHLIGVAVLIGIYAILIVGLDLLIGYGGQVNLGFQGFFAIGAYTTAILTTGDWVPSALSEPLAAVVMGCFLAMIAAYIIALPVLKTEHFYLALVTLAFGMIIYSLAMGLEFLGRSGGIVGIPPFSIGPLKFRNDFHFYYVVWAFVTLSVFVAFRMVNSQWGLAIRAMRTDEGAAEVVGINVYKYKLEIFLVTAIYAAVAGSLFAHHMRAISPVMFTIWLVLLVNLGLLLGGLGTIWGAIIGSALLQFLPEGIAILSHPWPRVLNATELIYGVIFILILFFLPKGILGTTRDVIAKRSISQIR